MKLLRPIVAIVIGFGFYLLFRYGTYALLQHFSAPGQPTIWTVMSSPASMLVTLLPSFIAAWLLRSHGLAVGFLVGLVGSGLYFVLAGSAASYFGLSGSVAIMSGAWFFTMCVVAGVYGAAAGGAAQLVRSNNSMQRTQTRYAGSRR